MVEIRQNKKMFKWLGYSALGIVLLLLTMLTVLSFTYDKAIIKYLKKNLNEHLLTEIIVDEIDFSMIKKFPYATVEFSNVVVKSRAGLNYAGRVIEGEDTLMQASKIYFQFGLMGLLKNEYHLKKIQFLEGKINIIIDNSGRNNFSIWKPIKNEKPEEDYHIEFQNVIISSFDFHYHNLKNSFDIHSFIKKTYFDGYFSKNNGSYSLKSALHVLEAVKDNKSRYNNLPVLIDLNASFQGDSLTISPSEIMLNKMLIKCAGNILLDSSYKADLTITSSRFGLDEIFSLIPVHENKKMNDFIFDGKGKFTMHMKGSLFSQELPVINADYTLTNGTVTNKNSKSKLSHINIKGTFSGDNLVNCRLSFSKMEARLSTGKINGHGNITNFRNPYFSAEIYSTVNLDNLLHLIEYDTIEYMNGFLHANVKAEGAIPKNKKLNAMVLLSTVKSGSLEMDDCSIKIKGIDFEFQDINGKTFIDNNITFQDFALTVNQTNFLIKGNIENLFDYLKDNQLNINANLYLYSKMIEGKSLLRNQKGSTKNPVINFPDHINIKAAVNSDELRIGRFRATNMKCDINYYQKVLDINNFNIKFIDGFISGNSLISQQDDSCIMVKCTANLNHIDIQQLFASFHNFGQNFILDENLKGKLDGDVSFAACWDGHMSFIPSSLVAQADIEVINGELLKFDPMLSLSKYINVDELKHIKFKTLKNTIYIYDQNIRIPEMYVHSSAFNISLSGTHTFSNAFDYRLQVALSDVLFKKAKRKKKEIDEYLIMESNAEKTILPLSIIGTPDNYNVEFDSKKAFNLIKEKIQRQGAEMKEFTGQGYKQMNGQNKKNNHQYTIEWEENQNNQPEQKEIKTDNSNDEIRIKWEEEDSSDINFFN